MASRLMHLAVGALLEARCPIDSPDRFRIGLILPDAMVTASPEMHRKSHFQRLLSDARHVMDHTAFFVRFRKETAEDPLYLGYYLHLIQDGIYRKRFYDSFPHGVSREALYRDYRILNGRLLKQFGLTGDLAEPADFSRLPLTRIAPFEIPAFLEELREDLAPPSPGDPLFLTEDWTETYLREASAVCLREIKAIREGLPLLPADAYSYEKRPD